MYADDEAYMLRLLRDQDLHGTQFCVVMGDGTVEPCTLSQQDYRYDVWIPNMLRRIRLDMLSHQTGNDGIAPLKLLYPAKGPDAHMSFHCILSNLIREEREEDLAEIIRLMTASEETDADRIIAAKLATLQAELARINEMMAALKTAKAHVTAAIAETSALAERQAGIQHQAQEALNRERLLDLLKIKNEMNAAALATSLAAPPTAAAAAAAVATSTFAAAVARITGAAIAAAAPVAAAATASAAAVADDPAAIGAAAAAGGATGPAAGAGAAHFE
jgi:hypothetical protein